jgi:hypothetical protein
MVGLLHCLAGGAAVLCEWRQAMRLFALTSRSESKALAHGQRPWPLANEYVYSYGGAKTKLISNMDPALPFSTDFQGKSQTRRCDSLPASSLHRRLVNR